MEDSIVPFYSVLCGGAFCSYLFIVTYFLSFVNTCMQKVVKSLEVIMEIKKQHPKMLLFWLITADYWDRCFAGQAECSAADTGCTADLADCRADSDSKADLDSYRSSDRI